MIVVKKIKLNLSSLTISFYYSKVSLQIELSSITQTEFRQKEREGGGSTRVTMLFSIRSLLCTWMVDGLSCSVRRETTAAVAAAAASRAYCHERSPATTTPERIDADCRRRLNRADGGGVATPAVRGRAIPRCLPHRRAEASVRREGKWESAEGGLRREGKFIKRGHCCCCCCRHRRRRRRRREE